MTVVDKAINSLVIKKIQGTYPDHSLLGEEESNLKENDYVWICDPIDGTIPFSHGYPICVFTLALTLRGEVILATIYDPFTDRLVVAERGKGAYLNDKKLSVSESTTLKSTVTHDEGIPLSAEDIIVVEAGEAPVSYGRNREMYILKKIQEISPTLFDSIFECAMKGDS